MPVSGGAAAATAIGILAAASIAAAQPAPTVRAPGPAPADGAQADSGRTFAPDPAAGELDGAAQDGAIDAGSYIVGPGDRMTVTLWGLHDVADVLEVNAEGVLLVPKIGVFRAGGLTLSALRDTVEKRLRAVYPSLRGALVLVRPRMFLVRVAGAVGRPGAYRATPLTRVSTLVQRAG